MITRVFAIGEAMAELAPVPSGLLRADYGGDVFNTIIHLKRLMGDAAKAHFVSAVGQDPFSHGLRVRLAEERVSDAHLLTDTDRNIGLYAITLSDTGERSFTYWRERSAARAMLQHDGFPREAMMGPDTLIYLSGITLAILPKANRERLMTLLKMARASGTRVAFDPNYRARLWEDVGAARHWTRRAYETADIIFTGLEDERLFHRNTPSGVIDAILQRHGERDIVVTDGLNDVAAHIAGRRVRMPTIDAVAVLDTTGAGDAFNAGFLSVYLRGGAAEDALSAANQLASFVVTVRGAIPSRRKFQTDFQGRLS